MKHLGIDVNVKHLPPLDPSFIPLGRFYEAFLQDAKEPFDVAVERSNGQMAVYRTRVHGTEELREADIYYIDRIIKTLLWMKGGFRVYLAGNEAVCDAMKEHYSAGGSRDFDFDYMGNVFEHPFEVVRVDQVPEEKSFSKAIGRHLDGCRIGFDAGGSDRKVSAVIDGESVYSEEVVWFPKTNSDPDYHYDGIVSALKSAAEHLPRVDAVGVSSAGVYIDNRTMNASLFLKVPKDLFDAKVKDIYIRAITDTFGVTGERENLERARRAYDLYWDLAHGMPDPVGMGPKTIPETRSGRAFGIPMIILNVTGVLLRVDPERKALYEERAQACVDEIFKYHVHPELQVRARKRRGRKRRLRTLRQRGHPQREKPVDARHHQVRPAPYRRSGRSGLHRASEDPAEKLDRPLHRRRGHL